VGVNARPEGDTCWPNTGVAVVREMGGDGHVAYVVVGDTINTASRLESKAPEEGVLIGAETRRSLPQGSIVEPIPGLRVKGKRDLLDAYLLHAVPIPS
jgi:adenylate cyclase